MGGAVKGIVGGAMGAKSGAEQAGAIRKVTKKGVKRLEPFREAGVGATGAVMGALGQVEGEDQDRQFQNFLRSTGFQSQLKAGTEAITGSQAARGMLSSGSTLKRLTGFGQDLAKGGFSNFLSNLQQTAGRGVQAASSQAGIGLQGGQAAAGAQAQGQSALQSGIGQAVGAGLNFFGI